MSRNNQAPSAPSPYWDVGDLQLGVDSGLRLGLTAPEPVTVIEQVERLAESPGGQSVPGPGEHHPSPSRSAIDYGQQPG